MRGYNQADFIARELSQECSLPYTTKLLTRTGRHIRQVTTKSRSERLKNQNNSFVAKGNVEGLHCILVDDVTTTGATIDEARKTLLRAGAMTVHAVTIAH
jgi:ComF family protein